LLLFLKLDFETLELSEALSKIRVSQALVSEKLAAVNIAANKQEFLTSPGIAVSKNNAQINVQSSDASSYPGGGVAAFGYYLEMFTDSKCSKHWRTMGTVSPSCTNLNGASSRLMCAGNIAYSQIYMGETCERGKEVAYYNMTDTAAAPCKAVGIYSMRQIKCATSFSLDSFVDAGITYVERTFNATAPPKSTTCGKLESTLTGTYSNACVPTGSSPVQAMSTVCGGSSFATKYFADTSCSKIVSVTYSSIKGCSQGGTQGQTCLTAESSAYKAITFEDTRSYAYPHGTEILEYVTIYAYSETSCVTAPLNILTATLNKCYWIPSFNNYVYLYYQGGVAKIQISTKSDCSEKADVPISLGKCQYIAGITKTFFVTRNFSGNSLTTPFGRAFAAQAGLDSTTGTVNYLQYVPVNTAIVSVTAGVTSYQKLSCIQGHPVMNVYTNSSYVTKISQTDISATSLIPIVCLTPTTGFVTPSQSPTPSPTRSPTSSPIPTRSPTRSPTRLSTARLTPTTVPTSLPNKKPHGSKPHGSKPHTKGSHNSNNIGSLSEAKAFAKAIIKTAVHARVKGVDEIVSIINQDKIHTEKYKAKFVKPAGSIQGTVTDFVHNKITTKIKFIEK